MRVATVHRIGSRREWISLAASVRRVAAGDPELRDALVTVFLTPGTRKELEARLRGRGADSEEAIRDQQNLSYIRDAAEAISRVRSGDADVAFLMNPVRMRQVRDIAFSGEVLPQKSTDFYPKLLSGLTIYALE